MALPNTLSRYHQFLTPLCFAFVVGALLACRLPGWPPHHLWLVGVGVLSIGAIILFSTNHWLIRWALWLLALVLGGWYYQAYHFEPPANNVMTVAYHQPAYIRGEVVEREKDGHRGVVAVFEVDHEPKTGAVKLWRVSPPLPPLGSLVTLEGTLHPLQPAWYPGGFDEADYLGHQKITAKVTHVTNLRVDQAQPTSALGHWRRWMAEQRQVMMTVFQSVLPHPDDQILGGIVLGSHAVELGTTTKQAFSRTGLIHYLAASGLNVGIIAGGVLWLAAILNLPFRLRLGLAMLAGGFYMGLAGLSPSVLRAGTMLELALAFKLINRQLPPILLLALAVTLIVMADPDVVANLGFQLSVLTTFGILTLVPPLQKTFKPYWGSTVPAIVLVPLVAQLWVTPLLIYHFNQLPLHSVLLNVLALLVVTPLTVLGFGSAVLSFVSLPLAQWTASLTAPFLTAFAAIVSAGDHWTWALWHLPSPPAWTVAALLLLLLFWTCCCYSLKNWSANHKAVVSLGLMAFIMVFLAWGKAQQQQQTRVAVLPLSQWQQAVIVHPQGEASPIVVTSKIPSYWEAKTLKGYLSKQPVSRIALLLTQTPALPEQQRRLMDDGMTVDAIRPFDRGWQVQPDLQLQPDLAGGWVILGRRFCVKATADTRRTFDCTAAILNRYNQSPDLYTQDADQPPIAIKQLQQLQFNPNALVMY